MNSVQSKRPRSKALQGLIWKVSKRTQTARDSLAQSLPVYTTHLRPPSSGVYLRLTATQIVLERLESRIKADRSGALTRCRDWCRPIEEAELGQRCQWLVVRLQQGWTPDTKHSPLIRPRISYVRTDEPILGIAGRVSLMAPSPWGKYA